MAIQSHRDLHAWQLGMEFVVRVYAMTQHFPRDEAYGLTAQLRRAAVAIPSNISEGHAHATKAYARFVVIATGSLAEAETQLELARRLRLAPEEELAALVQLAGQLHRVLHGLHRALKRRTGS